MRRSAPRRARVHPRSRGAALVTRYTEACDDGPSPLTRGSPPRLAAHHAGRGSIPAHAGQPGTSAAAFLARRVHPRSRGAAIEQVLRRPRRWGPSPLTRGSPVSLAGRGGDQGSIPAHAGQPAGLHRRAGPARVHPRSRGAAVSSATQVAADQGPSPLTRGSQDLTGEFARARGSIPAHAGQPWTGPTKFVHRPVHPRSRGAAQPAAPDGGSYTGPSPLTRGSLSADSPAHGSGGSIPAHAGQPVTAFICTSTGRVHPRSRGAAGSGATAGYYRLGPSPLTRGSLWVSELQQRGAGSIPAHAGQPRRGA